MKDLCSTCKHHWTDLSLPLEEAIPHCDFVDEKIRICVHERDKIQSNG